MLFSPCGPDWRQTWQCGSQAALVCGYRHAPEASQSTMLSSYRLSHSSPTCSSRLKYVVSCDRGSPCPRRQLLSGSRLMRTVTCSLAERLTRRKRRTTFTPRCASISWTMASGRRRRVSDRCVCARASRIPAAVVQSKRGMAASSDAGAGVVGCTAVRGGCVVGSRRAKREHSRLKARALIILVSYTTLARLGVAAACLRNRAHNWQISWLATTPWM